jgi:hypothetical protein
MRIVIAALLVNAWPCRYWERQDRWSAPRKSRFIVGDSVRLHGYQNAGGFSPGFPYHYQFISDAPAIADVHGFASGSSTTHPDPIPRNGDVFVKAVQPGLAHVRAKGYRFDLATITVLPQIGPVHIHAETTLAFPGQEVALLAILPGSDEPPLFVWYRGRLGDTSRLIQASTDPQLTFVAPASGPTYFWVQAFAGSATSSAEIVIETAPPPRRRTVRH